MALPRFHVVVFSDKGVAVLRYTTRGFRKLFLALLFIVLALGLAHSVSYYTHWRFTTVYLDNLDAISLRQRARLYDAGMRMEMLERELKRMADFSGKLQVMLAPVAGDPSTTNSGPFVSQVYDSSPFASPGSSPVGYHKQLARALHKEAEGMQAGLRVLEIRQHSLIRSIRSQRVRLAHIPSIWPTTGRFSSGFGYRKAPLSDKRDFHKGVDISAHRGTPVFAPAGGTVIFARTFSTYGKTVDIDHGYGVRTRYAHLHRIDVAEGDVVQRGDRIGQVGSTGRSTASHLHYEVYLDEKLTDPLHYILN